MNLFSAAAAFGVIVAVFQFGWLDRLVGVTHTGPITPLVPILMFAVLFGLSMDYEVFLVSRMHEEWLKLRDNDAAVRIGQAITGKTITRGGRHHDRGLLLVRDHHRPHHQDDRPGHGRRDPHRRPAHPHRAGPGGHAHLRQVQLGPARLPGPAAAPPQPRRQRGPGRLRRNAPSTPPQRRNRAAEARPERASAARAARSSADVEPRSVQSYLFRSSPCPSPSGRPGSPEPAPQSNGPPDAPPRGGRRPGRRGRLAGGRPDARHHRPGRIHRSRVVRQIRLRDLRVAHRAGSSRSRRDVGGRGQAQLAAEMAAHPAGGAGHGAVPHPGLPPAGNPGQPRRPGGDPHAHAPGHRGHHLRRADRARAGPGSTRPRALG